MPQSWMVSNLKLVIYLQIEFGSYVRHDLCLLDRIDPKLALHVRIDFNEFLGVSGVLHYDWEDPGECLFIGF